MTVAIHLNGQVRAIPLPSAKQRPTFSMNTPGTLAFCEMNGCEDSRKFVSGSPPKLVNWLTRLVNWAESLTRRGL